MLIHIHFPGPITNGVDSPARGESRWAQNIAKILANEGHTIVATGSGIPTWGETPPIENIYLVPESMSVRLPGGVDQFDLSMDPTWWKGKAPMVKARRYFVMKWSLEDYTRNEPLPENQYLCYPINNNSSQFYEDRCVNKDKTFFLPLPFGGDFKSPNISGKGLLWTCKDIDREEFLRNNARDVMEGVLYPTLYKNSGLYVIWLMVENMRRNGLNPVIRREKDISYRDLVPYYKIREIISGCRLIVAVNLPGSVWDASFLGVPTLEWEVGGFFNYLGKKHGVLIENGASMNRVQEVVDKFLYDDAFYSRYVLDIQNEMRYNTDDNFSFCFNNIIKKIF